MEFKAAEPMRWKNADDYYQYHREFLLKLHEVRTKALKDARDTGDQRRIAVQSNKFHESKRRLDRWTLAIARAELNCG